MIFHRAKFKTTGQDVVMQNSALTCVTTTKFLGVIIDHKFKWNVHISYICQKENFKVCWHSVQNSKIFRHDHVNTNVSFICFSISHLLR